MYKQNQPTPLMSDHTGDGFQDVSRDINKCQRLLAFSQVLLLLVSVSSSVG